MADRILLKDVGKALMLPEGSLDFNGSKLTVEPMSGTARSRANQNGAVANRSVEASSLMHSNEPVMMAPRIVRGRGRGRGGRGGRAGFSRS